MSATTKGEVFLFTMDFIPLDDEALNEAPDCVSILQIDALVTCLQMVSLQDFFGSSSAGNPSPREIMFQVWKGYPSSL